MRVILTGATGMVGEGVLLECLNSPEVEKVLVLGRKHYDAPASPKLEEVLVPDFMQLDAVESRFKGYDVCFYCAGISSAGMNEADYTRITYDTPLHLAERLAAIETNMIFVHISGASTDGSEKGRVMWARVKGRAENALMRLPFRKVYNFRPGLMKPSPGQKNVRGLIRVIAALYPVFKTLLPNRCCTLSEVGQAMIKSVTKGYDKSVLEVPDIMALARS